MMPTIHRLTGRFFTVLISLSIAVLLPRTVVAGEAIPRPPLASPAGAGAVPGLPAMLLAAAAGGAGKSGPTLCQISDTVYRADGSPAQGTVLLTWQAFTTAAGQSVTPGSLLVTLDVNGGFNASVAPNTGASPAGSYYKAIFKLNDGTTETEYWVVPNTQTTTIGAIRSKLVPANQAAQFLTRDFADSTYVSLASTQTISGVKTFSASPAVPTPVNPTDTANKAYVDANAGGGNLGSPPPIGNMTPNTGAFTSLRSGDAASLVFPYSDVRAQGALGNARTIGGCSITGGTAALACASGTFAAGDVGKTIVITEAGASSGCVAGHFNGKCPVKTTILSFTDSAHVTLAANATNTVSSTTILFGTNDLAAIQAAIDFAVNTQTSEFDVYIPHALGQGTGGSVFQPGCYLVDGSIKLPDSTQSQFKWVRLRGDGNSASQICEANWAVDVFDIKYPGSAGTEYWFKDFSIAIPFGPYYGPSAIHCHRCPALRVEGMWFSGFQRGIWADNASNGDGSQLLKIWGNTFEFTYKALQWEKATSANISQFLDMHDNMIDIGSFNWALDGSGNPFYPYSIDLNEVFAAKIYSNFFWGDGRGIRCTDCPDLDVYDNDFTFMPNTLLSDGPGAYGFQNLALVGTGIGYARRTSIHGNHFSSSNAEAVDVKGNVVAQFSGNVYSWNVSPQPFMSITASNGANTLGIQNEWIDACASPCVTVAANALAAGTNISGNYFAGGIATPISVAGSLPSGAYVALNSLDAAVNGLTVAGASTFSISPTVPDPTNNTDAANKEYVLAHAGGFGTPVTSSIQAAITAALANNGAPVIVPESYTGTDSFTNSSGIRVQDYREKYGIDSLFTRDVKEWGVKADAQMVACTATAGSPVLAGCQQWGSGSATNFGSSNIGQTVICYQCGASSGRLSGTPVYGSGGSGGTDGYQIVTFTNGGCTVAPIGSIQVSGGVPTGSVSYLPGNTGSGCASAPTQGTVATVTGTVTFSGATLGHLDLVTTISSVSSPTQIPMGANSAVSASIQTIYGTDDTAAWNAWAAALAGNASANALGYGETTFCGLSILSNTINLYGWGGYLHGCGLGSFNGNYGSKLIWAGHAASGLPMMNVQNGEEGRIDRIHFYGNTAAPPIGLQLARVSGTGNYIGTDNNFDQLWFGPMFDGSPSAYPNMTAAIFAHGPAGNDDFQRLGTIDANAVQVGFDSDNGNATYWDWQTFKVDFSGVGAALVGDVHGRNWFFGGNVTDLLLGSPTTATMTGRAILDHFGSEGSAQMLANGIGDGQGSLKIGKGSWQLTRNTRGDAEVVNIVDAAAARELELDNFIFNSDGTYTGRPGHKLSYGSSSNCTIALPVKFYNTNINPENIDAQVLASPVCNGLVQSPLSSENYGLQTNSSDFHVFRVGAAAGNPLPHYAQDWQGEASVTGVLNVVPSPVPTNYKAVSPVGASGSTAYNYEVTCVAGAKETTPSASFGTTTGNATLSNANYNAVYWWPLGGCDSYNVYGDEGSGSFGLLTNIVQGTAFSFAAGWPAMGIYDKGQYTKGAAPPSIDATGKVYTNAISIATDLTARDITGAEYFVSHYAGIQAAINAAYNNGAVLGTVIDDRTAPYSGPGFILYDSVTLKLAATTYTITSTVSYNNGNNNVTAGIVAIPGGRLIGASTSTNHGTIITAGNGLNADLIATSTVGTGIGAAAQWWHWGGFENLRVTGNGAQQTAGNCFNIENMGETAFLRTIEVSGCYLDNILFTGASATPSDIVNITTNSAGRYGFNFNNLAGVAVVHGLSGDSNTTSLVRLNGGQSGTLTILGFKTEEEVSGQDPLITIDQTGESTAQPSLFIVGGYTFGRNGVNDVIKYVNGVAGTTPYISVSNFYVQNYVNAVNDTVNNRTTAAANMNKVPFYYGPTGAFYSGQAFTLDLNTFVQSPHSGNYTLTEVFGTTSSNETLVAASGTSTDLSIGGIGFRMPNRSMFGQTPELFAKMTYAFPGGIPNTQQWEFIPAKISGDNSTRWIGDPSYRWDEIYSADVNSTTATVGTLNVTTCNGCGSSFQQVNSDWNANSGVAQIMNKPALATVATSGSYNDLTNKPSIPAPQVNSDWNAGSGVAQILNKPALAAVATSGSYNDLTNKPSIPVQGAHLVSGTMQGQTAQITGTGSYATLYSATIPAGTASVGTGLKCRAYFRHSTGSGTVTMQWKLGSTSQAYATTFTGGNSGAVADIEIFTPSSTNAEIVDIPYAYFGGTLNGPVTGLAWNENLTNANTIYLQFNVGNTDKLTGDTFYCQTVQ